jgi:hypothetical protein
MVTGHNSGSISSHDLSEIAQCVALYTGSLPSNLAKVSKKFKKPALIFGVIPAAVGVY